MAKEYSYKGRLIVGKAKVYIDTELKYQGLEINYVGDINMTSLLPNNYIVANGNGKIIIIKTTKDENNYKDLFSYLGMAIITKCLLVDIDLNKYLLPIDKTSLEIWNKLGRTKRSYTGDSEGQDWAYITRNWQDINFDGINNKLAYIHSKSEYDVEAKKITRTREIRKKRYGK